MKQPAFIIILLFSLTTKLSSQSFYTTVGEKFPDFEMLDINDALVNNVKLKGKHSLLVFFGTRCHPCLSELKELNDKIPPHWYNEFNLYAVGSTDAKDNLIKFKKLHSYNFKFIPDPDQKLFNRIADHTIPRTFLLDKKGIIISQTLGFYKTPFENLLKKMRSYSTR